MKRLILIGVVTTMLVAGLATPVSAGSPHFVGKTTITRSGDSLTVSGKIAGLGNEEQVEVEITAEAQCVNPGGNQPNADNKDEFSAAGKFPVQNGKATFSLTLTATFQPDCSPPMSVVFSNVTVTDLTHGISQFFEGPF